MSKILAIGDTVTTKSGKHGQIVRCSIGRSHGLRWVIRGYNFEIAVKPTEICGYEDTPEEVAPTPERQPKSEYVPRCGKVGYKSEGAAMKRAREVKRNSSRSKIPVRAYWCRECKMYHLTSKSDDRKR